MKRYLSVLWPFLMILTLCSILLLKPIADGDELWNYNFARNIAEGRTPYRDFNMLQTPLSAYIGAIFLHLFGTEMLVFRMVGIGLMFITFSLLYVCCFRICRNKSFALFVSICAAALHTYVWNYNYNNLNLCILMLIFALETKDISKGYGEKKAWYIWIGILYGIVPLIKQSTGAVLWCMNLVLCFYFWKRKRMNLRMLICRLLLACLPLIIFGAYTCLIDNAGDFYDYAMGGVGSFSHHTGFISYIAESPVNLGIGLFVLFTGIGGVIAIFKKSVRYNNEKFGVLMLLSAGAASVAYPLCDYVHMLIVVVPFIVVAIGLVKPITFSINESKICVVVTVAVLMVTVIMHWPEAGKINKSEILGYRGLLISDELESRICAVDEYIVEQEKKGIEVIVADEYGAVYMIPLKKAYRDFDMLLVGNLGTRDYELRFKGGNVEYLVRKDEGTLGYQTDIETIHYIKEKYKRIGEVVGFEIYKADKKQNRR